MRTPKFKSCERIVSKKYVIVPFPELNAHYQEIKPFQVSLTMFKLPMSRQMRAIVDTRKYPRTGSLLAPRPLAKK